MYSSSAQKQYSFCWNTFCLSSLAQTPQFISPRMATPARSVQQTTPGKISTLQIPVTLTIGNHSNLQSITSAAPGVTTLNMTPSSVLPVTNPGDNLCSWYFRFYNLNILDGLPQCLFCHFIRSNNKSNKVYEVNWSSCSCWSSNEFISAAKQIRHHPKQYHKQSSSPAPVWWAFSGHKTCSCHSN